MSKQTFVTPIQASRLIGKTPQQVYGWIRDGKIPSDVIRHDAVTGKPALDQDEFIAWYNNRKTSVAGAQTTKIVANPNEILEMLVGWMDKAGNKKMASDLQKVLDELKGAGTDESEVKSA